MLYKTNELKKEYIISTEHWTIEIINNLLNRLYSDGVKELLCIIPFLNKSQITIPMTKERRLTNDIKIAKAVVVFFASCPLELDSFVANRTYEEEIAVEIIVNHATIDSAKEKTP